MHRHFSRNRSGGAFDLNLEGGRGLTSTHNKRGCAILTRKVVPKNLGTYLKLRPKIREPETLGFPSK